MYKTKFRIASALPQNVYIELKDIIDQSYSGPSGKAFNKNSFKKLLDMQSPRSWEQLSSSEQERNFDTVYKYIYDIVYPKSKGQYQKEYIKEKYESGQVAKYEQDLARLDEALEEAVSKFDDIFENEKDTLKSYLSEGKTAFFKRKAALRSDDEGDLFFDRLKYAKFEPTSSDSEDEKEALILMKMVYEENKDIFDAQRKHYRTLDEMDQVDYRYEIIEKYFEKKDIKIKELKSLEAKVKEEADPNIEKDVATSAIEENTEIDPDTKDELKFNLNVEMGSTEKEVEEVKEEKKEEEVKEVLTDKEVNVFTQGTDGIPVTDIEKLNKWINVKCDLIDPIEISIAVGDDKGDKEKLLKDESKTKDKFRNLVKNWTKKNFKHPDTNTNYDFAGVVELAILDDEWALAIIKNKLDESKTNKYNWFEREYHRIQYKILNEEGLNDYEKVIRELLEEANVYFQTKIEEKDKDKQAYEILRSKILEYKKELRTKNIKSISKDTYSRDTYINLKTTGNTNVKFDLEKEREEALDKKSKNEKLNILEEFILKAMEQEVLDTARAKLRTNIDFMGRIRSKLENGQYSKISPEEMKAVKDSIDVNTAIDDATKNSIKDKLDRKEKITFEEFNLILSKEIEYTRKPLSEKEVEAINTQIDNKLDLPKIEALLKNPHAQIGKYKSEITEAKKKRTKGFNLTDLEKKLLEVEDQVKKYQKEIAPVTTLAVFISKCKTNDKLMGLLDDVLCKDKKLKTYESNLNKILHEVYSMIVNEKDEKITTRNKDRIIFFFKEAIKECNLRTHRENLHQVLEKEKTDKGATLLDFLPSNLIVEADSSGAITKMFTIYDNKLSDLKDKIEIQEELLEKFEDIKTVIYLDLKKAIPGDPATDSESFIIAKKKLLALIASIALETGLRPAPIKGQDADDIFGGKSEKAKLVKNDKGMPVLTPEGKKQFMKEEISTYGVATLKPEHIKFFKSNIEASLKFYGKKGVMNASKISQPELVKELEKLVSIASGNLTGPKSLFILPNDKPITNTDIVVYFESLAHKAGIKKLRITDFRKLKAVQTIHSSLLQQQNSLYKAIAQLKAVEKEAAKAEIAKLVTQVVEKAYKEAQKALSHSKVNETINSYVNPNLLLSFLASGGVDNAIEKSLKNKNTLKFDPEVFITQALAYKGIDVNKDGLSTESKDMSSVTKVLQNTTNFITNQFKKLMGFLA
jgi:hypothetical protein